MEQHISESVAALCLSMAAKMPENKQLKFLKLLQKEGIIEKIDTRA